MKEEKKVKICCLCDQEFTEWGNNPWPLKEEGACCDKCDSYRVLPARLIAMKVMPPDKAYEFGKWHYDNVKDLAKLFPLELPTKTTNGKKENKHEK